MIHILIPVFNAAQDIDATMQSIYAQKYDKENIYITAVDFCSSDGSYEKLLTYPSYHFGVYRYEGDFTRETMIAQTFQFTEYLCLEEEIYFLVLLPGDVIYPDYLKKVRMAIEHWRAEKPHRHTSMAVCEVDIKLASGEIRHNRPIYTEECLINAFGNRESYLQGTYNRNVLCFGGKLSDRKKGEYGVRNEGIWWDKIVLHNSHSNIVYIPDRLACIKERGYADELKEILLRWEAIIYFERKEKNKKNGILVEQAKLEENLAMYALWRSVFLKKRYENEQAEECFMISTIIYPKIKETKLYQMLQEFIQKDRNEFLPQIEEEFL